MKGTIGYKQSFTMAEILISLTIIGIIAAITLPSLTANINEKTWASQRKALYSRMSQAISMMPSLNGYGVVFENGSINEAQTASKAAQAFITDGLSKVLKISNICDNNNLKKCGFPDKFTKHGKNAPKIAAPTTITSLNFKFQDGDYRQINTQVAAFETVNGESILTFYNPNCSYNYDSQARIMPTMCANFVYDLNGKKGPNKVGKDIGFITAFYPTDSQIVAPYPLMQTRALKDVNHPNFSIGFGNFTCSSIYDNDAKMANIEELKSIFINNSLGGTQFFMVSNIMSSSMASLTAAYQILTGTGQVYAIPVANYDYLSNGQGGYTLRGVNIYCVKKF